MNDYIKKSEAIKAIRENPSKMAMYTVKAICAIEDLPTADVVPKSEVERLTVEFEAMRTAANSYKMHYDNLASEIFAEIENALALMGICFNDETILYELKKKYTEGGK